MDMFEDEERARGAYDGGGYPPAPPKRRVSTRVTAVIVAVIVVCLVIGALLLGINIGSSGSLEEKAPFAQTVLDLIDRYYYEDIDWETFQYSLAEAIASGVDPYTGLIELSPVNASSAQFGVTISSNAYNEHFIDRVQQGSPAATAVPDRVVDVRNNVAYPPSRAEEILGGAGLRRGDMIYGVKTEGQDGYVRVQNASASVLSSYVSAGDTAGLRVYRYGYESGERTLEYVIEFTLTKELLHTDTAFYVDGDDIGLGADHGYIYLAEFGDTSVDDFAAAAQAFIDDPSAPTKLILDLRGNGGGGSDILGFIASYFVKGADGGSDRVPLARYVYNTGAGDGEAWFYSQTSIESAKDPSSILRSFNFYDEREGFECVVLTDGGTASSAELLTWALDFYSENGVPTVGGTTYGKGVAQTVFTLENGKYELLITNGRYYLPVRNGSEVTWTTSIHNVGISPADDNAIRATEVRDYGFDECILRAAELMAD